jgi:hypothetical protein
MCICVFHFLIYLPDSFYVLPVIKNHRVDFDAVICMR